jgi:hypothetical protein
MHHVFVREDSIGLDLALNRELIYRPINEGVHLQYKLLKA